MAVPRFLGSLAKAAIVAALLAPPTAIWLSGRFGEDADRVPEPAAPAPRATLPRSQQAATEEPRPGPVPDVLPSAAPPVTVAPGAVTVPPPAGGVASLPSSSSGTVVGEPQGLPDPNKSQANTR